MSHITNPGTSDLESKKRKVISSILALAAGAASGTITNQSDAAVIVDQSLDNTGR